MRWVALVSATAMMVATITACPRAICTECEASDGSADSGVGDAVIVQQDGSDGGNCFQCSSDLHDVVDCNGNLITTCPPDQGCGPNGSCVPVCDSARANQSTVGCEYYAVNPGSFLDKSGSCFAVFIANTWTTDATLTVSYGGQSLNVSGLARIPSGSGTIIYSPLPNGKLPPGKVAILFLAHAVLPNATPTLCPINVTPGITNVDTASPDTGYMQGFAITSSVPVQAFDMFPYRGGAGGDVASATLLIPVSAWGTNYLGIHGYTKSQIVPGDQLFLQITSNEDNNAVTVVGTNAIVGGNGVAPAAQNTPATYTLNKGQVLQLMQDAELSGSPIKSTKPIGVWGGNKCMNIEPDQPFCDSAHQQLPPISAFGHEYVAVRHRDRTQQAESPPWRILGAVDNTQLTYVPAAPMGAPTTINARQLVTFHSPGPFVVKSQDDLHPFYMSAHMLSFGSLVMMNVGGDGDPEYVNVIPPQEFLDRYLFMTDPTMQETSIVLVRDKAKDGTYKDVKLDCLSGSVGGWTTIAGTTFQTTNVALVTSGMGVDGCDNGVHSATSDAPFGLTVWGWDTATSYAYPGGASAKAITNVIVPPIPK